MANTTFGGLFKEAKAAGSFDSTLPDGDFVLRVIRANAKTKDSGQVSFGLQLEVVQSEVEDDIGKKTWTNLYFTEAAAPISFRFLTDIGLDESFIEQAETPDEVAQATVGVEFDAEVGHRNWGKNGENVSNTFKIVGVVTPPAVGGAPDPSEAVTDVEDEEPF